MPKAKPGYYGVKAGRQVGVFTSWDECEVQVSGYVNAKYKKFPTMQQAEEYINNGAPLTAATISGKSTTSHSTNVSVTPTTTSKSDNSGEEIVYCDGACKGNGKANSVAGVGVWWGPEDPRNLAERCPGKQTNNRAELIGLVRVLEQSKDEKNPLRIKTDSKYSINCVNTWLSKWQSNGFRTAKGDPVENAPLIRYLAKLLERSVKLGRKVQLEYVQGHAGILGNEMADLMANRGAMLPEAPERDWEGLTTLVDDKIHQKPEKGKITQISREELEEMAACLDDIDDFELSD